MNNYHNKSGIFFLLLLVACFGSCKKFLEENPASFVSPENFYVNESDAYSALVGAYDGLGNNSSTFLARSAQYLTWFCSDECLPPKLASQKQLDNFSYTADQGDIQHTWSEMYDAINRANIVIGRLPSIEMDENLKQQFLAEASFLRGLEYFYGVRLWGELPLMTKEVTSVSEADVERSSVADVYNLIISDLEMAAANLPAVNENGRASKPAAMGLLAKVYLTRASSDAAEAGDYQKCADLCQQVIAMPEHHLMADYQKAIGGANEFNPESLFEWQGDRNVVSLGEHSILGQFTEPQGIYGYIPENATGNSDIASEVAYFNLYNDQDYRKESTFITEGYTKTGQLISWQQFTYPYPAPALKYVDQSSSTRSGYAFSANFVVLRLADVYLMRAEALNEINGPTADAYAMINAIRARARNRDGNSSSPVPADLSGLTKDQFRDSVLYERAIELGFEGKRWFDLVRTKRLVQTIKAIHPDYPVSDKHLLFPVPQQEILLNPKFTQNPGWE